MPGGTGAEHTAHACVSATCSPCIHQKKKRMFQKSHKCRSRPKKNRRRACVGEGPAMCEAQWYAEGILTCSSAASAGSFPESAAQRRYTHTLWYETLSHSCTVSMARSGGTVRVGELPISVLFVAQITAWKRISPFAFLSSDTMANCSKRRSVRMC